MKYLGFISAYPHTLTLTLPNAAETLLQQILLLQASYYWDSNKLQGSPLDAKGFDIFKFHLYLYNGRDSASSSRLTCFKYVKTYTSYNQLTGQIQLKLKRQ